MAAGQALCRRTSGLPNRTDAMFTADIHPGVTGAMTAKVEAVERYLAEA